MQLRAGLRVVRRAPDEVQLGTDSRWAVRVRGLTPEQADRLVRTGDRPLDPWLPASLIDDLATAGVLRPSRRRPPRVPPAAAPDAYAYALTRAADDGTDVLRARARATVAVTGLGRTGLALVSALATAGVGALELADDSPVRPSDVGTGASPAHVGRPRAETAAEVLHALAPHVRLRTPGRAVPDVAVTVSADVADPGTALGLLTAGVPHLPVVLREADALVGPFVQPGAPGLPCLRCLDLHQARADPAWPVVLAQLAHRERPDRTGVPAALATVAAGLAAAEVLTRLDGGTPRTAGGRYEIALPAVEPRVRRWAAHPDCGCAALVP
ncbi:ThiF family adenylyltransferase [Cellulomonas sp. C5510]|uniref:ThiF family adenylyltransferase n=1 Tax=Cellulomonas sp. C5510 TaxID=2871170 RepID=UPI001C93C106|nr:ThiF family adenylyltransferase [Cellulomonas sp. C5510]QZN84937.1 ThiF family adenylyltransferase [Cellulomonas sp. C5510]